MENEDLFLQHFQPHISLGGFGVQGQEALRRARVLVAGATGPALPALNYLAAMGVGCLGILPPAGGRETGLSPFSLPLREPGLSPLQALARHLRELYPEGRTEVYDAPLQPGTALEVVSRYDLVVSGSAQHGASLLLSDACLLSGIPLVWGAAQKYEGQLTVLNYKGGPTLRCLPAAAGPGKESGERAGVLGVLPGIIGGYMAGEAVKIVTGIGEVLSGKLLRIDLRTLRHEFTEFVPISSNRNMTTLRGGYGEGAGQDPGNGARSLTPHQLALKLSYQESLQLVDIREGGEATAGLVPGAALLPESRILHQLDALHQDVPVVLLSENGESARRLSGELNEKHGFGNIYYLEGGLQAWGNEGRSASSGV
jgi:sulfur-carrier protein adenylyltransferase/sulfurtransferase